MKILYVHQYFKTPEEGGCIRSYWLAKGLIDKGHEIVMITAHNQTEYKIRNVEGIRVHYLPVAYDNSFGFLARINSFAGFLIKAIKVAGKEQNVHLSYVMTTPLSTGIIALYLKKVRKVPYYFEVGDLWPAVPIEMGIIKNWLLKKLAISLEKHSYQNARRIVALSPGIKSHIKKMVPDKSIAVIPNMADVDFFSSNSYSGDGIKILYCGTIGKANHLEYLLNVAAISEQEQLDLQFTIIGEGAEKDRIAFLSKSLSNVKVLEFKNRFKLKPIIDEHDAFFISFLNLPILHTGSPNKFFDGLAAGKLIISNLGGWQREIIEEHQCGFTYDPENPLEFLAKITPYLQSPELLKKAQQNARSLAKERFSKAIFVELLDDLIKEIVD